MSKETLAPYWEGPDATFYCGDVLEVLRTLPRESVQCVVTSPPYYGLRDYGIEPTIWGGNPMCSHSLIAGGEPITPKRGNKPGDLSTSGVTNPARQDGVARAAWVTEVVPAANGLVNNTMQGETLSDNSLTRRPRTVETCSRCEAVRCCLGAEALPDCLAWARGEPPCWACFVCHLRVILAEVWRVLRKDGLFWLNLGDSYAGSGKGPTGHNGIGDQSTRQGFVGNRLEDRHRRVTENHAEKRRTPGYKAKDLMGLPWRVAFALQADGWWLRNDIIWAKRSCMPESVTDRATRSHEYIFQLAKSARYFYDAGAVREAQTGNAHSRGDGHTPKEVAEGLGIKSNSSFHAATSVIVDLPNGRNQRSVWHLGPEPFSEAHFATFPTEIPRRCIQAATRPGGVVLDCFLGSGTTALVARQLGRYCIGIDRNASYLDMAIRRLERQALPLPLEGERTEKNEPSEDSDLFSFAGVTVGGGSDEIPFADLDGSEDEEEV